MHIKARHILSACALLSIQNALASGMDCTKATTSVEKTICADTELYRLDTHMGWAYQGLVEANPQAHPELREAQRLWMRQRDQCAEDKSCLTLSYNGRLEALKPLWTEALTYQPDELDKQVSEDLRQTIDRKRHANAEFPLERTLKELSIKKGVTTFSNVNDDENALSDAHFPKVIPKGVTKDEWKALNASKVEGAGEFGNTSYSLMDLDGDGLRDLVVATYSGGTGLFTFIETFRRNGETFARTRRDFDPEWSSESALLSINDRGADQAVNWIKVRGRVYAAYRNSYYGVDHLYLLNPLKKIGIAPTVTVNYRYQLSIPRTQKDETSGSNKTLDVALHKALTQALTNVSKTEAKDIGDQSRPLCPIPPTAEDPSVYYSFRPGHYSFEIVADMPVMIGKQCYIGRMMSWFGRYSAEHGLGAQLVLRKPEFDPGERSYQINGQRSATDVTTSMSTVEGDDGM